MQKRYKVWLTTLLLSLTPKIAGASQNTLQMFNQASRALEDGHFENATARLKQCLEAGADHYKVHYNLGIAYYRMHDLGRSIFHFHKAQLLNPRDSDIEFNLGYARKSSQDSVESQSVAKSILKSIIDRYPLNLKESTYVMAFFILVWLAFSIASLFLSNTILRNANRASMVLAFLTIAGFFSRYSTEQPFGVVVSDKVNVYSGKGLNNVLLFSLHSGTEFIIKEADAAWLRIWVANEKSGWIAKSDVIY